MNLRLIDIVEERFYGALDPFFFFRAAIQFQNRVSCEVGFVSSDGGEQTDFAAILSDETDNLPETRVAFTHYLRFLAAETLVLMLLTGGPFRPYVRIASGLKSDALNKAIEAIAARRIPAGFAFKISGREMSFSEWVRFMLAEGHEEDGIDDSIIEFVAQEAKLITDRGAINAFKHGRVSKAELSGRSTIRVAGGNDAESLPLSLKGSTIGWLEWSDLKPRNRGEGELRICEAEADPDWDMGRIFVSALIVRGARNLRLSRLRGDTDATLQFPNDIPADRQRGKFTFRHTFECAKK